MTDPEILDFCKRSTFQTLRSWHLAQKHLSVLDGVERVYGHREARAWLAGKLLMESHSEFRADHFQPDPKVLIPDETI